MSQILTNEKSNMVNSSKITGNLCNRKLTKALSSIIVPLLIGVATVLISVVQLQIASKQRSQDLQIATERREQDFQVADNLQQDLILAAYIEQMSELMLSSNFTLTDKQIANVCRAKTLTALRQLNAKRKTHLIKFLYASTTIFHNQSHIYLADAELDGIDLSIPAYVEGKFRRGIFELPFQQTSLNNASFANRIIFNANFEDSSLIGANFSGCRISTTSFVNADLQYADFQNITSNKYIDFKSANLSGAIISDDILLNAISIQDAVLPNGTRGTRRNFLSDGDAEWPSCKTNTSVSSSWHVKQISGNVSINVNSYQSKMSVISPENSEISFGQCFFAAHGGEGSVIMWQDIPKDAINTMPVIYGNVVIVSSIYCASVGTNYPNKNFVEVHIEQFNAAGNSLKNSTHKISTQGKFTKIFRCHTHLDRIRYTLKFVRLSSPFDGNDSIDDIFYYCDNIQLALILKYKDISISKSITTTDEEHLN